MNVQPCDPTSAPTLADLQQLFMAELLGSRADDAVAGAGPDGELPGNTFDAHIAGGRMPKHVGLGIYTHAYTARLIEALDNDHPVLGSYLGDAQWQRACRGYIAAYPSRHRSLRDFGAGLPHYLAHAQEFAEHPQLAELAEFERRLLDSFDAADAPRASWQQLLELPPEQWPSLRPRFHPSLKLHRATCNSVEIWAAIKAGQTPPSVTTARVAQWALWRDAERISRYASLAADECASIDHSLRGGDFAGLCELLLEWHAVDVVPAVALAHLRHWCDEGWISHWG
ncbi:MAG: HvfC/BufC family peptide modification chaperone [Pseudomarimonas sp.]